MKTRHLICLASICLAFLWGCNSKKQPQAYVEWSLHCRATNQYLYENDGQLAMGDRVAGDKYLWITEATSGKAVRIRNKQSGNYLQTKDGIPCLSKDTAQAAASRWTYGGFTIRQMKNCSWYTLANEAAGKDKFLTAGKSGLTMALSEKRNEAEMHWTIVNENSSPLPFAIYPDSVQDASFLGLRTARAVTPTQITSDYHGEGHRWKLERSLKGLPAFSAPGNKMVTALYNLALEEMLLDIRTDSTFMAGALWPDTWTRDAVYSIYFSYAWILPEVSRKTLDKQTLSNPREALQDTGSGGSWPISTDRVVWAMAAWEYYLTSGNIAWLEQAYEGLSNTARKDIHVAFDKNVNLFKGETCSMDWRTHTYPSWFTNALIGESFSCGTNALHLFLYDFLGKAGKILNKSTEETGLWNEYHERVKKGIEQHFWNEKTGEYSCYLYPEFMGYRPTQRVGVMSNGLCAILGAATPAQIARMTENFPLYAYGAATLYPSIPDGFAYHNKGIWPVWETPYMYAAKEVGNMAAMEHIMQSLIRQSAMFLTHKENMTYDTGYDLNTALNSSRQLWSVSAYISMVYRILFGIQLTETGITFQPAVPEWIQSELTLNGFRYRDAVLNLHVTGYGNRIKSLKLDGTPQSIPFELAAVTTGSHTIEIEMAPDTKVSSKMNLVEAGPGKCWSPAEPSVELENNRLCWEMLPGLTYRLYGSGTHKPVTSPYSMTAETPGFYSLVAVNDKGFESELSRPVLYASTVDIYEAEEAAFSGQTANTRTGFSGKGYITDLAKRPSDVCFTIRIPEKGNYLLSVTGANGEGPDGVYCAVRSVFVDGKDAGTFLLEASGNWEKWTESNHLLLKDLPAGEHTVQLLFNPEKRGFDNNMSHNRENKNDCLIDFLKVVKL